MEQFNFYQPTRIHFGAGRLNEVGRVVSKYGKKCMLVTTTNTEDVLRPLYDRVKGLLAEAGIEYAMVFSAATTEHQVEHINRYIQGADFS